MNYSKNLRKAAMARRVIFLTVVAAVLGLAVGGVSGYALKTQERGKRRYTYK